MRIFCGGLVTETNTFSPLPTGYADFEIWRAADVAAGRKDLDGFAGPVATWQRLAAARGWEFIFSLYAFAQPAGRTVRHVYESLRDEMLNALAAALPVDIVLLPLHGAMVAEGYDDCETDMLQRVRALVGPDARIGVELDLHCDVTEEMCALADAIVLFKEYPHTDIVDRAVDLFHLIAAAAEGNIQPTMGLFDCRMIGFYLTPYEPMRSFVDDMLAAEGKDGILSLSVVHCFPWADVPTTGARFLAITDGDAARARRLAETWGRRFYALRHELLVDSPPMTTALDRALAVGRGPVVVADQADNPGGGAPSDSTFVLRELLARGVDGAAVAMIRDPIAVQVCMSAGVGAQLQLRLGGKMGPTSGDPLDLDVEVIGITPDMHQTWPQGDGEPLRIPAGDSVGLRCRGVDIVVNSQRGQVFHPSCFSSVGIDPLAKRLLVVKSTQHFYAGFAPIASKIIYMSAPGAIAPQFTAIPYQHVDLHKFPWVDDPLAEA